MAGKGRGVAAFTFNIEALGIGRGSMPEARVGPSPLYPEKQTFAVDGENPLILPLGIWIPEDPAANLENVNFVVKLNTDFKPVPLKVGEDEDYMLALKQEMRGTMQRLSHNIKAESGRADVEKYTERYLKQSQMEDEVWTPDWNLFPKELMPRTKKTRTKVTKNKKSGKGSSKEAKDVLSKLDELEKKDDGNAEKSDDEPEKKTKNEDEEEMEEEEYEEEDIEEDNDYIESYFDNGEDFAPDSDDDMDREATY